MAALNQGKIIKGLEQLTESPDPRNFFFDFLKVFGFSKTTIKRLQENDSSRNIAVAQGDYGLTKQIYFRQTSDSDISEQIADLRANSSIISNKVRFIIVTDFRMLAAYDAKVDDSILIDFADLSKNFDFFLPLTGQYEKPLAYAQHPADVKACEKMGRLYDILRQQNHYETADDLHSLNVFLTRLLFCFFAEDTDIFPRKGQMTDAMEAMTSKNGSDLQWFYQQFFEILDIPEDSDERRNYAETLQQFPYVNGGLFREKIRIPDFNARGRNILLECGRLEWNQVSPIIFGSMFQAVMDLKTRHDMGAHFTSERNIFKVIRPLFLDGLETEFQQICELKDKSTKKKRLDEFQTKLSELRFLDPACGSGNFLVVTYREIKTLELKALTERLNLDSDRSRSIFMDWQKDSRVSIDHFYGIEIEEFPVEIARVSMWLMQHVMNRKFGEQLGAVLPSLPLKKSANIHCANALTTNWCEIVAPLTLSYIYGNPPFGGASIMSKERKEEVVEIFKDVNGAGILDYVAGWYGKASKLLSINPNIECAYVSTNSVCQGEQVAPLWKTLFDQGITINFAHQTFQWSNEAKKSAAVFCVIIGFSKKQKPEKYLYRYKTLKSDPDKIRVNNINAYLLDLPSRLFVQSSNKSLGINIPMVRGNQPTDGGNLIVESNEVDQFLADDRVRPYIKKLIGSKELLHSLPRYCLWLVDAPEDVKELPIVAERIERCREMRLSSRDPGCRKLADRAYEFRDINNPSSAIVIPGVSSERRQYIPMGFIGKDPIVTNLCHMVPNGTLFEFGILESGMHMTWMRTVCGRMKSDYRYSRDLCYNTFPWPSVTDNQKEIISNLAQRILDVREFYPEKTLSDLYDPDLMPVDLVKAHRELDAAIEKLYRKRPFDTDEQRLKHLFLRYEKLVNGEDASGLFSEE